MAPKDGRYMVRSATSVPSRSATCETGSHGSSSHADAPIVARAHAELLHARRSVTATASSAASSAAEARLRASNSEVTIGIQSKEYSMQNSHGRRISRA